MQAPGLVGPLTEGLPSTELHGAPEAGGSQVGVGAVAAERTLLPLTHHCREPKTAFDTKTW